MTTHGGRVGTGIDAVDWARRATELGAGADAVLAASVFHFGTLLIAQVKTALRDAGHPVR